MRHVVFALLLALLTGPALAAENHTVTDDTGRDVTIPQKAQHVVILHEPLLGIPAMDLGANIVGLYGRDDAGNTLTETDFIETVLEDRETKPLGIGPFGEIDLEKLRALKPDLILGTEYIADQVPQLSKVAPVYLQHVSSGEAYGFSVEKDLSEVLGLQDAYQKRLETYQHQLGQVQAKFGAWSEDPTYLAVIIHDQLNLVGNMSGAIQAIEDIGYQKAELDGATGVTKGMGATFSVPLSPEVFGRLDPDLLIVMNSYVNGKRSEDAIRAKLDKIIPGWDRFLKPAREGRILFLDSAMVATPSIASALHTLDAYSAWRAGQ